MLFVWDEWNLEHIAKHDVAPNEAEEVANGAARPFPKRAGRGKYLVRGETSAGRYLQVIYVHLSSDTIDVRRLDFLDRVELERIGKAAYIIHARDLSQRERHIIRRGG